MLLDNEHTKQFIPQALHKVNAHGVHSNGIKMVAVLSGSIILAQSFVPGAAAVLRQLTKLNSVCMPMRYLWVFAAYIALRNAYDTIPAEYRFVKIRPWPSSSAAGALPLPPCAACWVCMIRTPLPLH